MRRLGRVAGGLAVLAGIAVGGSRLLGGAGTASVQDDVVRRGALTIDVPATGMLAARRSIDITAPISSDPHFFKIARIVAEGTLVRQGDTILELDAIEVTRRIEDDQAELEKTQSARRKRQLEYDLILRDLRVRLEEARVAEETATLKQGIEAHLISSHERRQFALEYEQAKQARALLRERLTATEQMMHSELTVLDRTLSNVELRLAASRALQNGLSVKAPMDGTLLYKVMADGAKRKVGEQTCHHEIILQIPDLSTLRVQAMVNEQHAGVVRVGQPVTVRLDALPDVVLTGRVAEVGLALTLKKDNPIRVVDTIIDIDKTDARLGPGMTATARIEVDRADDVLLVPERTLYARADRTYAQVVHPDGRLEERAVRVGRRGQSLVEIVAGLRDGERVRPGRVDPEEAP
jgi:HlyD family secretion protein